MLSNKINLFLDSVCGYIKCKSVHKDIRDELTNHINELKEGYLQEAQSEEAALEMAISAMGDSDKIGKCLNKQHMPQTEWSLIGLTVFMAIIGGVVMFMSSRWEHVQVDFSHYLFYTLLGITMMTALIFFDYTKLKKFTWPIYLTALAILAMTIINGARINGASRFISLGGLSISTVFTSLLFIVSFAGFIENARGRGTLSILKLLALAVISVLPILMQPNMTQTIILSFGYLVLIVSAITKNHFGGSRKCQMIILTSAFFLGLVMFVGSFFGTAYRIDRLTAFATGFLTRITGGQIDQTGAFYQQAMADKWLSASNLFGATTERINGHGLDRAMPNATTDFAFINVIASLGWIVGIVLILSIVVYIFRMLIVTRKVKDSFGFFIALGACTILAVQFTMGILVNFNLLPPMSVSIPFISYGGIGYIVSMVMIGLILSVWRRNNLLPSSPKNISYDTSFIK